MELKKSKNSKAGSGSNQIRCPKCRGTKIELCGQSMDYAPESHPAQPLHERARQTLGYRCECGMGFTHTVPGLGAYVD